MTEDIPHAIAEPVAQIGDHLVSGVAIRTVIAAELEQGDRGTGISQDMVAPGIDRTIESRRLRGRLCHAAIGCG
jgi:hypothetical protein